MDGKAKTALYSLDKGTRGNMVDICQVIIKARVGHPESGCHFKKGVNQQHPEKDSKDSSPSTTTLSSPPTVTLGKSAHPRGPCRDCGTVGHYTAGYSCSPKHIPSTKQVNLISATTSTAMPPDMSHPKRVWTQSVSVAPLDGSSLTVNLQVMACIRQPYLPLTKVVDGRGTHRATPGPVLASHKRMATKGFALHCEGKSSEPSSGTPDSKPLPVPLESPEPCQAPSISDVEPPLTLTSLPGPELVLVPDPSHVTDPPTGDPPKFTELTITNCEPPAPDDSFSQSPSSVKNEPLADLNTTPSLVDQEQSGWDAETVHTLTTIVPAAQVGSLPIAPRATSDSAPDGTSGLSPELIPSSPPRNGIARPWWNPKKKKGSKRSN
ncbi:uncharacterized protein [Macrobrachium rosenbergii]|uniref:uncharacterized protein n=1 Tax=Macrobrachium rosenbergii TaxID=79674 RepID=UPI0034D54414